MTPCFSSVLPTLCSSYTSFCNAPRFLTSLSLFILSLVLSSTAISPHWHPKILLRCSSSMISSQNTFSKNPLQIFILLCTTTAFSLTATASAWLPQLQPDCHSIQPDCHSFSLTATASAWLPQLQPDCHSISLTATAFSLTATASVWLPQLQSDCHSIQSDYHSFGLTTTASVSLQVTAPSLWIAHRL